MSKNVMIICDKDKNYCNKLDSFIRDNLGIPFNIYEITDANRLYDFLDDAENALLLISEAIFEKNVPHGFKHILVLREKEISISEEKITYGNDDLNIRYTDKYQKSENITDSILSMCLDIPGITIKGKSKEPNKKIKVIGFYTPERDVDQTVEAIRFARKLSDREKTLFINTDSFCTNELLRNSSYDETIVDLIYFSECAADKFGIYLERVVKHDKNLEFVPSSLSPFQCRMIKSKEYKQFIKCVEDTEKYLNIVLDISEGINELFEILHICDELYVLQDNRGNDHQRIGLLINELQKDEEFDMKKLHRIEKAGGEIIGA
ncbi:hypothetical protein [Butyrivibrio sp. AE3004]|uniref:hypothetical protein n=1 Tax=Butyrivibrio sp. AE3004 TaxID=1506994 RepID=UPI000494D8DF|nr:hypothetical protein [Butyrivibrio sp. AE3004]